MKSVLTKVSEFLVAWAESLHEYRNRKGYRSGGYY